MTIRHPSIMGTYPPAVVRFVRGEGSSLFDSEGKRYLDLLSGLGVTSLGHAHPDVAAVTAQQASVLVHVSNLFANEFDGPLAEQLDELVGGGGKVFFANSGAEANECAIKLARRFGGSTRAPGGGAEGRYSVVTAFGSFHGRTLATLRATGQPHRHETFQPLPEGFKHAAWADVGDFEARIDDSVAAVLIEPIQGEGGVQPAPEGFLKDLSQLCTERGVLLMIDEVQSGLGRTGKWFGFQHDGISPDVVTMAKALGNGMPIGACWARAEVADVFEPGDHATTYGGQPLAAATALKVIETMRALGVPELAERAGERLRTRLEALPHVVSVRGAGLLLAVELDVDSLGRNSAAVTSELLTNGVVVNAVTPTALRLAPSLLISDSEIDEAITKIEGVLT